ncbi:MAG: sigma-54 dependent transcriptional regulator [Desulfobacterales bacterium]|nr:sigma-54 dependent transcriptional regulator [Desulfobacterales bacterium]
MKKDKRRFTLLLVDDEPNVLDVLKKSFFETGYRILTAARGDEALKLMSEQPVDVALIDYKMPEMDGMELLERITKAFPHVMVVMLTGFGGVKEAVSAIKAGAVDFLEKPFVADALLARIAHFHNIWRLQQENLSLKEQVDFTFGYDKLVGNASSILRLKELIIQMAGSDAPVLIEGETGTGKELVARAIHQHSGRSGGSFVPVDCASISENVIESELFGHVKGAFTGAHASTPGLIRTADGGTLFLDELGELPLAMQAKLLRTIQEGEVRPVGSSRTWPVDVRVVTATNRDMTREVADGNFREDLFYRLNILALKVPPLRERLEDLPTLVRHFIHKFRTRDTEVDSISDTAMRCLENHEWPGNVRELENVIRRAVALSRGHSITPRDLPDTIYRVPNAGKPGMPDSMTLASWEAAAITHALVSCGNNRKRAAQALEIGEATLYRKLKKYNINA